jgi:peptide/nickel transport system substrate-binding protein
MVEALGTEPTTLDISYALRRPEAAVLNLIHEPLFIFNKDLKPEPLLVETWNVSQDYLTWTFTLKKGITFHDGTPLDAEAVKFSLERHMEGVHSWRLGPLDKVEVVDQYTVRLKYKEPYPLLLNHLANYWLGMISPKAVEKYGEDYGVKAVVGTGPFKFKEWISGDRIILEKNEDYKHGPTFAYNKGPAYVNSWIFRFILEPATLIAELTVGDVDISTYIPEEAVGEVRDHPNTDIVAKKAPSSIHIAINTKNPPFDDVRVRRAVAHAINKEAVIKAALFGVGEPLYTLVPANVLGYWEGAKELGYQYTHFNPEKAKELLEEAGWVDVDGDGIREKDDKELEVVFFAFTIVRYKLIAEVVQPMLEAVGFKVKILVLEAGDLYERVIRGEHHLLSTAWMGITFVQDVLVPTLHSKNIGTAGWWFHYSNPVLDKLLDDSMALLDSQARQQALNEAQRIVIEEAVCAPIAYPMDLFGHKKIVGGVNRWMEHPWAFQVAALRGLELYKTE